MHLFIAEEKSKEKYAEAHGWDWFAGNLLVRIAARPFL